MGVNIFKNLTGVGNEVDESTNEYEVVKETHDVDSNKNKMILLEPRAFSESQQIADYLKNNSSVVVNLKRVTPEVAKRIVDFLNGVTYAIEGNIQKLGGGIFLCAPDSVQVEGSITDEQAKQTKVKKDEEEDFNW